MLHSPSHGHSCWAPTAPALPFHGCPQQCNDMALHIPPVTPRANAIPIPCRCVPMVLTCSCEAAGKGWPGWKLEGSTDPAPTLLQLLLSYLMTYVQQGWNESHEIKVLLLYLGELLTLGWSCLSAAAVWMDTPAYRPICCIHVCICSDLKYMCVSIHLSINMQTYIYI